MENKTFEPLAIVSDDEERIVVRNNCEGMDAVLNGLDANDKYFAVTKGAQHDFIVYDGKGRVRCSFDWGDGGHMVISKSLEDLKHKILRFILSQRRAWFEIAEMGAYPAKGGGFNLFVESPEGWGRDSVKVIGNATADECRKEAEKWGFDLEMREPRAAMSSVWYEGVRNK